MHSTSFVILLAAFAISAISTVAQHATKVRQFERAIRGIQGMCITPNGYLIQGHDSGQCSIYDLNSESSGPVAVFPLGSASKDNHANALALSDKYYRGGAFPLLYVTGGQPTNGIMECNVENILKTDTGWRAERVQRIVLSREFVWDMQPGSEFKTNDGFYKMWGAPSWLLDNNQKCLYVFSATYRTTKPYEQFKKANRYIVTKLRLPDIGEGDVTLTRKDVLDQMVYDFDVFFSQSGCVNGSEIYYVFGHGKPPGEVGGQPPAHLQSENPHNHPPRRSDSRYSR
jgi:hypothetical protein